MSDELFEETKAMVEKVLRECLPGSMSLPEVADATKGCDLVDLVLERLKHDRKVRTFSEDGKIRYQYTGDMEGTAPGVLALSAAGLVILARWKHNSTNLSENEAAALFLRKMMEKIDLTETTLEDKENLRNYRKQLEELEVAIGRSKSNTRWYAGVVGSIVTGLALSLQPDPKDKSIIPTYYPLGHGSGFMRLGTIGICILGGLTAVGMQELFTGRATPIIKELLPADPEVVDQIRNDVCRWFGEGCWEMFCRLCARSNEPN